MYPGQQGQQPGAQGQPYPQGPYQQPGPYPQNPYQGGQSYPPQHGAPPGPPYQGQAPYPPQAGQPYPPQQPYSPQQMPQQPQAPVQQVGEGQMRIDPNLTTDQRTLILSIQKNVKVYVLGFFFGVMLTSGGLHHGITEKPVGFVAALVGLLGLVLGVVFYKRTMVLREQLRQITPDAWRSPAAHLLSARRAALLAAYLNGLLVLLSLGATGYLLYMGVDWGAYGNSFGFAALVTAAGIPLSMALAAGSTIPQLMRVVPAGANVGRALYGVIAVVGVTILIKGDGLMPKVVGGAVTLVCAGAMALLGRAVKRMRGEVR